jgi:hypothetical protein
MALFTGQREEVMELLLQLNVSETRLYVMPLGCSNPEIFLVMLCMLLGLYLIFLSSM